MIIDNNNTKQKAALFLTIILMLILMCVYSAQQGALAINLREVFFSESPLSSNIMNIWLHIRLPRIVAALIVGALLAICGASMQGIFRNPLVDPGIVGIMSGAALFASLFIVLGQSISALFPSNLSKLYSFYGLPVSAFLGGWLVMTILYKLSQRSGQINIATMLLLGIVINAIAGAITALLMYVADDTQLRSMTFWSMGTLSGLNWSHVSLLSIVALMGIPLLMRDSKALNAMIIGENIATHIGFDIEKVKKRQILTVSLLVGCCVSVAGGIGFIGLVIPHIARNLLGSNHKLIFPLCIFLGGFLLIFADTLSRTLVSPAELPIGILTGIIGAPFLGYLIWQNIAKG